MRVLFVQHQDDCPPGLVGDRLAELGARIDVADPRRPLPDPAGFDLIVPLGSDDSVTDQTLGYLAAEAELLAGAVRAEVPVFGICFGAQLLCRVLGGSVAPATSGPEIDWMPVEVMEVTNGATQVEPGPWLVWHEDVMTPPAGSVELARSAVCSQAFGVGRHLGVQFHPEATLDIAWSWARGYRRSLDRIGRDPEEMLGRMAADQEDAHRRVATLVDRVLAHTGLAG